MVDIHSHILWGVDDGARTEAESLAMLKQAFESGTTDIVATPHANTEYDPGRELLNERLTSLRGQAPAGLEIHVGRDMHLSPANILNVLKTPGRFTINSGKYVLVEFPDLFISPSATSVLQSLTEGGLTPIVTHPERNPVLQRDTEKLRTWVEAGCWLQVTAGSLLGRFGKSAAHAAWRLIEDGLTHVVASDAHDPEERHARLDEAYAAVKGEFGQKSADDLFTETPRKALMIEA